MCMCLCNFHLNLTHNDIQTLTHIPFFHLSNSVLPLSPSYYQQVRALWKKQPSILSVYMHVVVCVCVGSTYTTSVFMCLTVRERKSACMCAWVHVKHSCCHAGLWWDQCDLLSLPLPHPIMLICSGTNRRTPLGVLKAHSQSPVLQKIVFQSYLNGEISSFCVFPLFAASFYHFALHLCSKLILTSRKTKTSSATPFWDSTVVLTDATLCPYLPIFVVMGTILAAHCKISKIHQENKLC